MLLVDYYSERATEFTSIFETEDYVYLTYSEPAIETLSSLSSEPTAYSRIARVCKNDRGRGKDDENPLSEYLFATLFKTRLMCGDAGVMLQKPSSGYISQQFSGYYGVYINEIGLSITTLYIFFTNLSLLGYADSVNFQLQSLNIF